MPISRQTLSETLSDDLATLHKARAALSNAWALRMSASLKAHFAAIANLRKGQLRHQLHGLGWRVYRYVRTNYTNRHDQFSYRKAGLGGEPNGWEIATG